MTTTMTTNPSINDLAAMAPRGLIDDDTARDAAAAIRDGWDCRTISREIAHRYNLTAYPDYGTAAFEAIQEARIIDEGLADRPDRWIIIHLHKLADLINA